MIPMWLFGLEFKLVDIIQLTFCKKYFMEAKTSCVFKMPQNFTALLKMCYISLIQFFLKTLSQEWFSRGSSCQTGLATKYTQFSNYSLFPFFRLKSTDASTDISTDLDNKKVLCPLLELVFAFSFTATQRFLLRTGVLAIQLYVDIGTSPCRAHLACLCLHFIGDAW